MTCSRNGPIGGSKNSVEVNAARSAKQVIRRVMTQHPSRPVRAFLPDESPRQGFGEFGSYAKTLAIAGDPFSALRMAEADPAIPDRVARMFKSAVAAGTTTDPNWAGGLIDYRIAVGAFIGWLQHSGVFDYAAANGMRRTPLEARVGAVTGAFTANEVGETQYTPVSALALSAGDIARRKAQGLCVVTDEVLRTIGSTGQSLLNAELKKAVIAAADIVFLAILTAAATPVPSAGTDESAALADLAALFGAVQTSASSALFFVMSPGLAKTASLMRSSFGGPLFPDLTPLGGTILKIPVLLSDQVGGRLILVDADQIAGDAETIVLEVAAHATIKMAGNPAAGADTHVSLWQTNSKGLLATRWLGARVLGSNAVGVVEDVDWGSANGSDA